MKLKVGDVVIQIANNSIWQMESKQSDRTLLARCVYDGKSDHWKIGNTCPFTISPLNSGVVYLGTDPNIDIDVALAIIALTGAYT